MNKPFGKIENSTSRVIFWDFWSLLLFLFIIGLLTVSHISGLSKIMILYGMVLMAGFSIYLMYHRLFRLLPEVVVYLAWIIWASQGVVVAIDKALFMQKLMTVIQIGFLLFLVSGILSLKRNMSTVMLAIIIGGVIVVFTSFYSGEFLQAGESKESARVAGIMGNANGFAYHLMFVVYAVFFFWKGNSSKIWRIILLSILGLSALGIVYSGSRTGIIAFVAFLLLWWYFCHKKKLPKNPIKMYIVLLILLVGIYYSASYVIDKTYLGKRIQIIEKMDSSSQKRLNCYIEGVDMIIHNPVFGVGLSNFVVLSSDGLYSHSNYIEIASCTGIIGFFIFFSIYLIVWRRLNRIKRIYKEPQFIYTINLFKASILTMLIQSFSTVNYFSKLTWIFLAAVIGYTWSLERSLLRLISAHKEYLDKFGEEQ